MGDEQVRLLDDRGRSRTKRAVPSDGRRLAPRRSRGGCSAAYPGRLVGAVADERLHPVLHEPPEGGERVRGGGVVAVAVAVEDDVEDVVVVAADELGVAFERQQEVGTPRESGRG